jgi:hypothetical protein
MFYKITTKWEEKMARFSEEKILSLAQKRYAKEILEESKLQQILKHVTITEKELVSLLTKNVVDHKMLKINRLEKTQKPINSLDCKIGQTKGNVEQMLQILDCLFRYEEYPNSQFLLTAYLRLRELIFSGLINKDLDFVNVKESFAYCPENSEMKKIVIMLMYELAETK